ncbi:MAG: sulfatase-like hydrolase/transferase [Lachnospiraceae bacterium]|nr:sulfatase-like hydrolase/transferase [Lachnospiraceae bacterium]
MIDKKKVLLSFIVSFLPVFMILVFGPAEIFFANVTEFDFLYGEFAGYMAVVFLIFLMIFTVLLSWLPEKIYEIALSVLFVIAAAGYLQVMFFNKNLDLLGVNPDGYHVPLMQGIWNLIIWMAVLAAVIMLSVWKKEIWKKALLYLSVLLVGMQAVALVSLLVTAPEESYERAKVDDRLWGKDQYTVSADKNIIVFVLDYFSSLYLQQMMAVYPDGADCLHDFTYYSNADCTYYGTFPSLAHMLTGGEVDTAVSNSEWCRDIWDNDLTEQFYQELHANQYKVNVYTTDFDVLTVGNGCAILRDKISNITDEPREVEVDTGLLLKTLTKMSCYRMAPDLLKTQFYTNVSEYSLIVQDMGQGIAHTNSDFFEALQDEGLKEDDSSNYFIFQHLIGTHEFNTDEYGKYQEKTSVEETARGCMTIMEKYLDELKRLGVYDDATIIITADHGGDWKEDMQVIYFIKQPGEVHDASPVTNAPISHCDLLPTVAQMAGMDYTKYGKSIYDFQQDEQRERTIWVRTKDPDYPEDVYYCYTYTGDILALITQIDAGPTVIQEMYEPYY